MEIDEEEPQQTGGTKRPAPTPTPPEQSLQPGELGPPATEREHYAMQMIQTQAFQTTMENCISLALQNTLQNTLDTTLRKALESTMKSNELKLEQFQRRNDQRYDELQKAMQDMQAQIKNLKPTSCSSASSNASAATTPDPWSMWRKPMTPGVAQHPPPEQGQAADPRVLEAKGWGYNSPSSRIKADFKNMMDRLPPQFDTSTVRYVSTPFAYCHRLDIHFDTADSARDWLRMWREHSETHPLWGHDSKGKMIYLTRSLTSQERKMNGATYMACEAVKEAINDNDKGYTIKPVWGRHIVLAVHKDPATSPIELSRYDQDSQTHSYDWDQLTKLFGEGIKERLKGILQTLSNLRRK